MTAQAPSLVFRHVSALTDACGLVAHADGAKARPEDGYSVDDNARALIVVCREPRPAPNVGGLSRRYLDFVLASVQPDGRCHNRMAAGGLWDDEPGVGDWWGRAVWALAVASTSAENSALQVRALAGFQLAARQRSTDLRAMAFAGLGAAEVLRRNPGEPLATALLTDAAQVLWWDEADDAENWPWPEPRLGHANGALAEAMLSAGDLLGQDEMYSRGLEMLQFLINVEVHGGHLSVAPVEGRGVDDERPAGVQLPSDVAALGEACATAFRMTREQRFFDGVKLAWNWFTGDNDAETVMFDRVTGAGFDSLDPTGRSDDQGAASTVAMLATAQHARRLFGRSSDR